MKALLKTTKAQKALVLFLLLLLPTCFCSSHSEEDSGELGYGLTSEQLGSFNSSKKFMSAILEDEGVKEQDVLDDLYFEKCFSGNCTSSVDRTDNEITIQTYADSIFGNRTVESLIKLDQPAQNLTNSQPLVETCYLKMNLWDIEYDFNNTAQLFVAKQDIPWNTSDVNQLYGQYDQLISEKVFYTNSSTNQWYQFPISSQDCSAFFNRSMFFNQSTILYLRWEEYSQKERPFDELGFWGTRVSNSSLKPKIGYNLTETCPDTSNCTRICLPGNFLNSTTNQCQEISCSPGYFWNTTTNQCEEEVEKEKGEEEEQQKVDQELGVNTHYND